MDTGVPFNIASITALTNVGHSAEEAVSSLWMAESRSDAVRKCKQLPQCACNYTVAYEVFVVLSSTRVSAYECNKTLEFLFQI